MSAPSAFPAQFIFATGIECSNPTIENGRIRRDLLAECGHYQYWQTDLHLVREMGIKFLRYGLPIHQIYLSPGHYEWGFADQVMSEMQSLGIEPILDLLHFGLPHWLGNFQNPEFPEHFADYVSSVANRYPWVRFYTPVNEAFVTAKLSAREGLWNEQLRSDTAFVTALKHLTQANILAAHALAQVRSDVVIMPSESVEICHSLALIQSAEAKLFNQLRFLSLDLLYGRELDQTMRTFVLDCGMNEAELHWFENSPRSGEQILGLDYYGHNEFVEDAFGQPVPETREGVLGFTRLGAEYYNRYRKPLFHTETNFLDGTRCSAWLAKQWHEVRILLSQGVPLKGFTWYSLCDQIDWDCALAEKRGTVNTCGLYNLDRQSNPVAHHYRNLIKEWGEIEISETV